MNFFLKTSLLIIILQSTIILNAQDKDLTGGIGGGMNYGINEGKTDERTFGPTFGALLLFRNGLGERLTPEFSFTYNINQTSEFGGFSQYKTNHIMADLRLRYYPLDLNHWAPYMFGGFGLTMFDVAEVPDNIDPKGKESGSSLHFPIGAGISNFFSPQWGIDFNLGVNLTLTDDLNPVYDDVKDAMWVGKLSVLFKIHEFKKDSDGDGLSDEDEQKLGTDPNNPDTDGDGLLDGDEVEEYKTDPNDADTDDGGIIDGVEVANGANPLDPDDDILSIAPGGKLILRNIEFATGKSEITKKSERILGYAARALKSAPDMEIEIVGHTDDVGVPEKNLQLSIDRANSVKAWLVKNGIEENRLKARGEGQNEPLVPNTSNANRQKNRRVEFIRLK